ncbi:MAG TPA: sugar transferase [Candidatus Dormibacteraeota bacterium]|nr:sugar transferase [Candidatus Dormibacteraeota bacterium]
MPRNAKRTFAAWPLPSPLLPEPRSFAPSGFDLANNNCLQTGVADVSWEASRNWVGAAGGYRLGQEAISPLGRFAKRILDLLVSSIAILFLWPLMLAIAIAVKLESRGPAIYASLRVGKGGVPFVCYKFRTMVPGANGLRRHLRHLNQRRGPFFKIANDPRITPFGRFLRKYSLDELPQLWNVLRGEMSLVGPRPHPLEDCAEYSSYHCRRLGVKPGIAGLWQILARTNPSFDICMMLDLSYIEAWSLMLDCEILMRSIPAVLAGEGQ